MQISISIDSSCKPKVVCLARNAISPGQLFQLYTQTGFLYPQKRTMLEPYWDRISENWRRGLEEQKVHTLLECESRASGGWGSVSSWRHTPNAWNTQHLVSTGGPAIWGTLLLSKNLDMMSDDEHRSSQCWYQRSNRYANRVFGGIEEAVGPAHSWTGDFAVYTVPFQACHGQVMENVFVPDATEIDSFISMQRSRVYSISEDLSSDDMNMMALDDVYREHGLRRYRKIFAVADCNGILGAVIAYRGPLGFNFSFLENRCDLILRHDLEPERSCSVARALLSTAAAEYADFELGCLLVSIPEAQSGCLDILGGAHMRNYAQTIWLREGYQASFEHFSQLYEKAIRKSLVEEAAL